MHGEGASEEQISEKLSVYGVRPGSSSGRCRRRFLTTQQPARWSKPNWIIKYKQMGCFLWENTMFSNVQLSFILVHAACFSLRGPQIILIYLKYKGTQMLQERSRCSFGYYANVSMVILSQIIGIGY